MYLELQEEREIGQEEILNNSSVFFKTDQEHLTADSGSLINTKIKTKKTILIKV